MSFPIQLAFWNISSILCHFWDITNMQNRPKVTKNTYLRRSFFLFIITFNWFHTMVESFYIHVWNTVSDNYDSGLNQWKLIIKNDIYLYNHLRIFCPSLINTFMYIFTLNSRKLLVVYNVSGALIVYSTEKSVLFIN